MRAIKVVNKQVINASIGKVMNAILDCESWPTFLPGVKKVEILAQNGLSTRRLLHSKINGSIVKMVTETFYDIQGNRVEYKQVCTPWPLVSNVGEWTVKQVANGKVELTLVHKFKVRYSILGYLFGLFIIKPLYIYRHNKKDLLLYKKHIENE